jgi:uncharacterized membrane protein
MRSQGIFLIGYMILVGALIAALWKLKVLERIGTGWTVIIIVGLVGLGVMLAVARGGQEIKIHQ